MSLKYHAIYIPLKALSLLFDVAHGGEEYGRKLPKHMGELDRKWEEIRDFGWMEVVKSLGLPVNFSREKSCTWQVWFFFQKLHFTKKRYFPLSKCSSMHLAIAVFLDIQFRNHI